MAHTHDLEWEVGSKRIICMYDDCNFVMEEKDIIAIIGNHAAQQNMHLTWWNLRLRSAFHTPQKYQRQKRNLLHPPRR